MATANAVKERPVVFSDPEVKAALDGLKSQFRRIVKVPNLSPNRCPLREIVPSLLGNRGDLWDARYEIDNPVAVRCPFGKVGDLLWVREAFARRLDVDPIEEPDKARDYALYRADGSGLDEPHWHSYPERWTPANHMPHWAARILLEITGIHVELLSKISEADAIAEGVTKRGNGYSMDWSEVGKISRFAGGIHPRGQGRPLTEADVCLRSASTAYGAYWNKLIGNRSGYWPDPDPWVWVVSFRKVVG